MSNVEGIMINLGVTKKSCKNFEFIGGFSTWNVYFSIVIHFSILTAHAHLLTFRMVKCPFSSVSLSLGIFCFLYCIWQTLK